MTTITNDYHDTEATTVYLVEELCDIKRRYPHECDNAEKALVHRLHDRLCGSSDCTCGDIYGARPGVDTTS